MKQPFTLRSGLLLCVIFITTANWQLVNAQKNITNESFESAWISEGTYGPHVIPPHNFTSNQSYPRDQNPYNGKRAVEFNAVVGAYLQSPEMKEGIGEVWFYMRANRSGYNATVVFETSNNGTDYTTIGNAVVVNYFTYQKTVVVINSADARYFRIRQSQTSGSLARTLIDYMTVETFQNPPPSSHVYDLNCPDKTAHTLTITWLDTATVSKPKGYVVRACGKGAASIPTPIDGIACTNDLLTKVVFAPAKTCTFSALPPETAFDIKVFPFTNSGIAIDYLTEGDAPAINAKTNPLTNIINSENFNSKTLGNWTQKNLVGSFAWGPYYYLDRDLAWLYGFQGAEEDWLISPPLYLNYYHNEYIHFINARNGTAPLLKLLFSVDYDGIGNPNNFTWTELPALWASGYYTWRNTGNVDLSFIVAKTVYLAVLYKYSNQGTVWLVDDIMIEGNPLDKPAASVANIMIDGVGISNFNPAITQYQVPVVFTLKAGGAPDISCETVDPNAEITVVNATNINGSEAERTATITVTALNGDVKTYSIIFYISTNVSENIEDKHLIIYPNPFNNSLYINQHHLYDWIEITSVDGKLVGRFKVTSSQINNLDSLNKGIYIIRAKLKNGKVNYAKIVKQ
jgi:hypothetical protein